MGQLGQAFQNPNTFAADPSGFNGSEWAARFMGGAAKGLGQGMQQMTQQNAALRQGGGGGMMPTQATQPSVDLGAAVGNWGGGGKGGGGALTTAADGANPYAKRAQNPFYGGYNPG